MPVRWILAFAAILLGLLWWVQPLLTAVLSGTAREKAMLLSALLAVFGTFISAIAGVLVFQRQQAAREKDRIDQEARDRMEEQRQQEVLRRKLAVALRAEIIESLVRLKSQFTTETILATLQVEKGNLERAFANGNMRGMPAGVGLERNAVFDNHQRDIYEFPEPVIRALVRYYQNDLHMIVYLNRMTEGSFDKLELDRQKKAVVYFRDLGQDTLRSGLKAKALLDAYLYLNHPEGGSDETAKVSVAREVLSNPSNIGGLRNILELDKTSHEDGEILSMLPTDDSTEHIAEFMSAIGISE